MVELDIATGELPKFKKDVLEAIVAKISKEATDLAISEVKSSIQRVNAVASGQLLNSVTADFASRSSRNYIVNVGTSDRAAEPIEQGLKPGVPVTVDRIYEWMIQKNLPEPTRWGAYYIARKLYNEGYTARRPFELAEDNITARLNDMITDILNSESFTE